VERAPRDAPTIDTNIKGVSCGLVIEFSAAGNRLLKVIANALSASFQRIVHRVWPVPVGSRDLVTRYRHFNADCSVGKWPLARTARR
jgi:hypothetical protein